MRVCLVVANILDLVVMDRWIVAPPIYTITDTIAFRDDASRYTELQLHPLIVYKSHSASQSVTVTVKGNSNAIFEG